MSCSHAKVNTLITGRDGFYVTQHRCAGAWLLNAGHVDVVGGLFQEWSDSESEEDKGNRARRMIRRARNEGVPATERFMQS